MCTCVCVRALACRLKEMIMKHHTSMSQFLSLPEESDSGGMFFSAARQIGEYHFLWGGNEPGENVFSRQILDAAHQTTCSYSIDAP